MTWAVVNFDHLSAWQGTADELNFVAFLRQNQHHDTTIKNTESYVFKVSTHICGTGSQSFKEVELAAMSKGSHRDDHTFLQMPVSE